MKQKHTPGPWFINGPFDFKSDLFIRATVDGENFDIASTYDDETGNAQANAELIAAAPDLLEACERAKLYLTTKYPAEADIFNQLNNAIRKANGDN